MKRTTSDRKEWHFLLDMLKRVLIDITDFVQLIRFKQNATSE